jgi:hypothetical protein
VKLLNLGLKLDEVPVKNRMYLDEQKIQNLLKELGEFLNFEDLMQIKKQLNLMSYEGRILPDRLKHMEDYHQVLT